MTTEPTRLARSMAPRARSRDGARSGDGGAAAATTARHGVDCRSPAMSVHGSSAIETSCDETAVAVVDGGRRIHSNVVASQVALHAATGGIVPEVAARGAPALDDARCSRRRAPRAAWTTCGTSTAIAVTEGPGLAGSLLVGITMARTLAWDHRAAARAREPPRGPHLRRVAAGPRRAGAAGARVPARGARGQRRPHVPGRA